jgi:hypothetical protein
MHTKKKKNRPRQNQPILMKNSHNLTRFIFLLHDEYIKNQTKISCYFLLIKRIFLITKHVTLQSTWNCKTE